MKADPFHLLTHFWNRRRKRDIPYCQLKLWLKVVPLRPVSTALTEECCIPQDSGIACNDSLYLSRRAYQLKSIPNPDTEAKRTVGGWGGRGHSLYLAPVWSAGSVWLPPSQALGYLGHVYTTAKGSGTSLARWMSLKSQCTTLKKKEIYIIGMIQITESASLWEESSMCWTFP